MNATEKFRQDVHHQIEQHADRIGLPEEDVTVAKEAYDEYINEENAYSRPDSMFGIAAVYVAVRSSEYPLSMEDVVDEHEVNDILRVFRRMMSEIGVEAVPQDPKVFVDRITDNIRGVSEEIGEIAKDIIDNTPQSTNGKRPKAVAAGAYYLASKIIGNKIQQDLISNAADVSNLTIRNRYQEMEEELPEDYSPFAEV